MKLYKTTLISSNSQCRRSSPPLQVAPNDKRGAQDLSRSRVQQEHLLVVREYGAARLDQTLSPRSRTGALASELLLAEISMRY